MRPHRATFLKVVVATIIFGSIPACIRVMKMDSYALGVWRLSLASIGMTVLMRVQGRRLSSILGAVRRDWRVLTAVGVCFGLHWLTYFQSIKLANASIGSLGYSTCGVQLPLLGWLFGFGRPGKAALVGVALGMAGSVMCLPELSLESNLALGLGIGILSGTFYAALPMLHQRHAKLDNELRTWSQFTFALPVFFATAYKADWTFHASDFWFVLYLGLIVNLVGHYLWVQICTDLPLSTTSALGYLQLPATLAMNYAFIHEQVTPSMLLGGAFIITGNILALRGTGRPLAREAAKLPAD